MRTRIVLLAGAAAAGVLGPGAATGAQERTVVHRDSTCTTTGEVRICTAVRQVLTVTETGSGGLTVGSSTRMTFSMTEGGVLVASDVSRQHDRLVLRAGEYRVVRTQTAGRAQELTGTCSYSTRLVEVGGAVRASRERARCSVT